MTAMTILPKLINSKTLFQTNPANRAHYVYLIMFLLWKLTFLTLPNKASDLDDLISKYSHPTCPAHPPSHKKGTEPTETSYTESNDMDIEQNCNVYRPTRSAGQAIKSWSGHTGLLVSFTSCFMLYSNGKRWNRIEEKSLFELFTLFMLKRV